MDRAGPDQYARARLPREHFADLKSMVRNGRECSGGTAVRPPDRTFRLRRGSPPGADVVPGTQAWSRGRSPAPTEAAEVAAPAGGVTCAGGVLAAVSSSSFIPALKALMPLAKSPMTRGSLPAPNKTRTMARTISQCIKLIEPM